MGIVAQRTLVNHRHDETIMAHNLMSEWIAIEPSEAIQSPPRVAQRVRTSIELDGLRPGQQYIGLDTSDSISRQIPADVESRPGEASHNEVSIVQSLNNPPMNKWRFFNACLLSLAQGMNGTDGEPKIRWLIS